MHELQQHGFEEHADGYYKLYRKQIGGNNIDVWAYGEDRWNCNIAYSGDDNLDIALKQNVTATWVLKLVELLEGEV